MIMPAADRRIPLPPIPEPEPGTRSVFVKSADAPKGPFFMGEGDTDFVCGACNTVLASGIDPNEFVNLVFRCEECGAFCEC
jgi:hypothetical protein